MNRISLVCWGLGLGTFTATAFAFIVVEPCWGRNPFGSDPSLAVAAAASFALGAFATIVHPCPRLPSKQQRLVLAVALPPFRPYPVEFTQQLLIVGLALVVPVVGRLPPQPQLEADSHLHLLLEPLLEEQVLVRRQSYLEFYLF